MIFDYDGTLHDSIGLYAPAFRKAFEFLVNVAPSSVIEQGYALDKYWEDHEISQWLGYRKDEMWQSFMPNLDDELKEHASSMIGAVMLELIDMGHAKLYPRTLETLAYLKKQNYTLLFLSNCSKAYMEAHKAYFQLDAYFDAFYCAGQYPNMCKAEILSYVLKTYYPRDGVLDDEAIAGYVIGDRIQDVECAVQNGFLMIGCSYGYGCERELSRSNYRIDAVEALKNRF